MGLILISFVVLCLSTYIEGVTSGCKLKGSPVISAQMNSARQCSELLHFALAPLRNQQFPDLYNKWLILFNEEMVQASIYKCDKNIRTAIRVYIKSVFQTSELFRDLNEEGVIVNLLSKLNPVTSAMIVNGAITTNYVFQIMESQPDPPFPALPTEEVQSGSGIPSTFDDINTGNKPVAQFDPAPPVANSKPKKPSCPNSNAVTTNNKPSAQNELVDNDPTVENEFVYVVDNKPIAKKPVNPKKKPCQG